MISLPHFVLLLFCSDHLDASALGQVYNPGHCPCGWMKFGKNCFKYFEEKTTWSEAGKKCIADGGTLVSIHSSSSLLPSKLH